MQIFHSKFATHLKSYVIAVIVLLQAQAVYVAWDLNHRSDDMAALQLSEMTEVSSSLIGTRIESVVAVLQTVGKTACREIRESGNAVVAQKLLDLNKKLWNYNLLTLVAPDGTPLTRDEHDNADAKAQIQLAAQTGSFLLERCPIHNDIFYAVPVIENGKTEAVLLASRGTEKAYGLLRIPPGDASSLALLIDHKGDVLVHRWNVPEGQSEQDIAQHVDFIQNGRLLTDKIGHDYSPLVSGHFRFSSGGTDWVITQQYSEVNEYTIAFVAPEDMFLTGLSSLRSWNLWLTILSLVLIFLLILDFRWLQNRYHKSLEQAATTDPLTMGPNLASFAQHLRDNLQKGGGKYAVVSMDINKFKVINDEYGVAKANELLVLVYKTMQEHLREGELCCRATGDRFLLLLLPKEDSPEAVTGRVEKIITDIMRRKHTLGIRHQAGFAAGVYMVQDSHMPPVLVIDHANSAHEVSKNTIGTPVTFYDAAMDREKKNESDLLNSFSKSLEDGDFFIQLQPKVNIRTDLVAGAEALVRWKHPVRGLISPGLFLPVLEKSGRIIELDLWVFEAVCAMLARWKNEGREIIPIAVNVSRTHLKDELFLNNYLKLIQKYDIIPQWIELELTETVFMEDEDTVSQSFATIRSHGLRCAIDDFGIGYSSLSMLKNTNVDTVKLDRTFFEEPELSAQTKSVLRSITHLASALGLSCVAEGVEEHSAVEFLLTTDCSIVQGYVFSRPLNVEDFEAYAFNKQGRRRLLDTGSFYAARRALDSHISQSSQQVRKILDSLAGTGVFVVKKNGHELLFCNEFLRHNSLSTLREGAQISHVWATSCEECPLHALEEQGVTQLHLSTSVFGCPATCTVNEILWEDYVPAYLVSLVPNRQAEGDLHSLRTEAAQWKKQAQEDQLTSLLTKAKFIGETEEHLLTDQQGVLMFIDVDGFKQINDTYGHQMGDAVLKNCSERIRLSFRRGDLIGRFGGDEFLVYAPGFARGELLEQRLRMLESLMRHPHSEGGHASAVSVSIGVACFPADGTTYRELEAHADSALYEAKRRGKDQHVYFDEIR